MKNEASGSPRVTVIMCTYNHGSMIGKSIESVFSQSFRDLELIIVNDGSTDATREIVKGYQEKDSRLLFIDNTKNMGVPRSFNAAFQRSRGELIARVDSDDAWIGADKLEKQVRFLDEHPDHVATGGGMVVVDPSGKELYRYLKPVSDEDIRKSALVTNPIANSTSICRRAAILDAGLCDETLDFNEDWDFWLKIGLRGKLYNFPEYFSYYTMTGRNKSAVFLRKHTESALRIIYHYHSDYPNFPKGLLVNSMQYVLGLVPFEVRQRFHPTLSRVKKTLAGSPRAA